MTHDRQRHDFDPGTLLTLQEAADLAGCSFDRMKRARISGDLPGARPRPNDKRGTWLVPIADLVQAGYLSADVLAGAAELVTRSREAKHVSSLLEDNHRQGELVAALRADVRRNLIRVLHSARDLHGVQLRFEPASVHAPTSNKPKRAKSAPLSLRQTAEIAGRLHPVHAFALLLMRIVALRISEAYGLRVRDYMKDTESGRAVLVVTAQGGRFFYHRVTSGDVERTTEVANLKTASSDRVLPIGKALQELIDIVIAVFHTDPDTGLIDVDARLIPDLTGSGTGQNAFRTALHTAARASGLAGVDAAKTAGTPVGVTPHAMRRSLITALAHDGHIQRELRQRYAGHVAGEGVHESYILDGAVFAELAFISQLIEDGVRSELPDGLVIATAKRCTTRVQSALYPRAATIDALLAAAGWLVTADADGDVLDARELASLLGIAPGTARRLLRSGAVATVALPGGRDDQRGIRVADAVALADDWSTGVAVSEVAEELGLGRASIHQVVNTNGWPTIKRGGMTVLPDDTADLVRAWHCEQLAVRRLGVTQPDAARQLSVPVAAVKRWALNGTLTPVPGDTAYLTRESVEQLRMRRVHRRHVPVPTPK